jgi:hypothetical protein
MLSLPARCPRCHNGYVQSCNHVIAGECFRCRGTGIARSSLVPVDGGFNFEEGSGDDHSPPVTWKFRFADYKMSESAKKQNRDLFIDRAFELLGYLENPATYTSFRGEATEVPVTPQLVELAVIARYAPEDVGKRITRAVGLRCTPAELKAYELVLDLIPA